nr:hypothetical protein CFP56_76149 [Quercus suber]
MEADEESDSESAELREGLVAVPFSKEIKALIRSPWSKSLIVKVYEDQLIFIPPWLTAISVEAVGRLDCVDLEALQIIGNAISKVLQIDTHIANESRGQFTRLCIQVDVGKPMTTTLLIGGKEQPAREAEGKEDAWVSHGDVGRDSDKPGTIPGMSKDKRVCEDMVGEDTLVDNAKDMEGKRKVGSEISTFEAQMANVVQSIANGPNHINKSPGQHHVEKNGLEAELSLSVRGKKGIARNRASLSVTNKEVVNKGESTSAKSSFLDSLSVNGNASFNFKAKSFGHSPSINNYGQQSRTEHMEMQPSAQAGAQEISKMVEEGDGESSQFKIYSDGLEQSARDQ